MIRYFESGKSYCAIRDTTILGFYSGVDLVKGNIIYVNEGDQEENFTIECSPRCILEVSREHLANDFEIIDIGE